MRCQPQCCSAWILSCASRYEVVKKKTKFDDAMMEMEERICRQFCTHGRPQCGIVYCLSRNDCEKVAAELGKRLAARLGHRTRVR